MLAVLVLLVFFSVIGGMVWLAYNKINNTNVETKHNSNIINSSQDFFPFEKIERGMIYLGGQKYRGVIEVSSISYDLKTEAEKNMIEISFQRFVNSLSFPIAFYIQTTVVDNAAVLERLKEDSREAVSKYPQLSEYAEIYYRSMERLEDFTQNNRVKRKFIIIPYEESIDLGKLTEEEKTEYSIKELRTRMSIIADGLSAVGLKARFLDNVEITKLLYSSLKKDSTAHIEDIVKGHFSSMVVNSLTNTIHGLGEDAKLDWILNETENKINAEVLKETLPEQAKQNYEACLKELKRVREKYAGFFKGGREDVLE